MMQLDSAVFLPHKTMLKFITQKLRAQSLNEVQPYDFELRPQVPALENGDYYAHNGSDSEEENHEVEHYLKDKRMCNSSVTSSSQNNNTIVAVHSSKPLRPLEDSSNSTENIQNQTLQTEKEKHSSEEELVIYDRPPPEKRKFSQVCSWGMVSDTTNSSSSDEEVKELCFSFKSSPIQFGSSPPKNVPRIVRRHADSNNLTFSSCPSVCETAQPRKRHRHSYTIDRHYTQSGRCMDFEKMQQKQITKRSGSLSSRGPRVVRIKSINVNNRNRVPPRLLCDPAVFSFKSLTTMTPVEEPAVAAY